MKSVELEKWLAMHGVLGMEEKRGPREGLFREAQAELCRGLGWGSRGVALGQG